MSDILFLASDYIERMANPSTGFPQTKTTRSLATLLRKEGFAARLNEEETRPPKDLAANLIRLVYVVWLGQVKKHSVE